uniref:Uncharacterized protein n=1 Tax=Tetranychus urticae TaxID=32264 RepID=T1KF74_TETUR
MKLFENCLAQRVWVSSSLAPIKRLNLLKFG